MRINLYSKPCKIRASILKIIDKLIILIDFVQMGDSCATKSISLGYYML